MTALAAFRYPRARNLLLSSLTPADSAALRPHLTETAFKARETMLASNATPDFAYFPVSGMVSLLSAVGADEAVEVAVVGIDGIVGLSGLLGGHWMNEHAVVQMPCRALRAPMRVLCRIADQSPAFRLGIYGFVHRYLGQLSRSAACSARHSLQQRLARWLLTADDHSCGDALTISHEGLAALLGMRRAGVSVILSGFRGDGLIAAGHNRIVVLDHAGLAKVACGCYRPLPRDMAGRN